MAASGVDTSCPGATCLNDIRFSGKEISMMPANQPIEGSCLVQMK
jgi:hypothetical protein